MRTIKLIPTEFYQFRLLAMSLGLFFLCEMIHSEYYVRADSNELEQIGY